MKNKKRIAFVICILFIFSLWLYITVRGNYLQILGVGEEYVEIFKNNMKQKSIVFILGFTFMWIATYITTSFIKKGLKKFFDEDKKEMPKLPNKSISLLFGLIAAVFFTNNLTEKAILVFNNTWFTKGDPIFNIDIGYYIFQNHLLKPLLHI